MYQISLFLDVCKKRMESVSDWGFVLSEESSKDDWALLTWELEGISISIDYHPYAYIISTYVKDMGQDINVRALYDSVGIDDKSVYQFGGTGLEKGIETITGTVLSFLSRFDRTDHADLKEAISKIEEQHKTFEAYELERADQLYLSSEFDRAKAIYMQYDYALSDIQKKRLERIKSMS